MEALIPRPTVTSLLIDGFNAIRLQTLENLERGEATDITQLLQTLQLRIKDIVGYDYPLPALIEVYALWSDAN